MIEMVDERNMFLYNILRGFFGAIAYPGDIEEVEQDRVIINTTHKHVEIRFTLTDYGNVIINPHDLFHGDTLALMLWKYSTVRRLFQSALKPSLEGRFDLVYRTLEVSEKKISFAAPYKRTLDAVYHIYITAMKFTDGVITKLLEKFADELVVSAALISEELE